jgi:PAS domain S-box-containing protein
MGDVISIKRRDDATTDARLAAIVDSSFDAIISKDLNSIITSWNAAAEALFGYNASEIVGKSILTLIPPSRHGEEADIIARIKRGERIASFETVRLRKDGKRVMVSITISPIRNSAGEIVGASKIARDVTAAKENERRIKLLMREVNHRVKNQFAIIISMVRETSKQTSDPQEFHDVIRERISALSRSHDLLVSTDWSGASLFDLIQEHLKPFGHDSQITLSGPLVSLAPTAVQPLGMALHELATNSAKYGALSGVLGKVSVTWEIAPGEMGDETFTLSWHETFTQIDDRSGPVTRKGFGHVVLTRVTPQSVSGTASIARERDHLDWLLTAPSTAVLVARDDQLGDV